MNKWISVKKRMPKACDNILGYDIYYNEVGIAKICDDNPDYLVFINSDDCKITHWMPLPKPPSAKILKATAILHDIK